MSALKGVAPKADTYLIRDVALILISRYAENVADVINASTVN